MQIASFSPEIANAKKVTVSLVSQSIDITSEYSGTFRVANTSSGEVAINVGTTEGAVTAAFTDGNGIIIPAGGVEVFAKAKDTKRFAVIGASANGTVQITPGMGA